ncbi:hypothetical protein [Pseudomonas sp. URMO17WK12:I12]|uniref:hypothetical protein n=1 Tax=Pseudomonas sp. URMO17WK12:I12 TaxID=1259797 RepID=UPI000483341E|nr:hypothetical protein [Pseudomonas sp. URMO17WK12:I12]
MTNPTSQPNASRKWLLSLLMFFLAWLVSSLLTYCLVSTEHGYWLELFNGATWPSQFVSSDVSKDVHPIRSWWFYVVIGFRTAVNLGVVLSAAFWLFTVYLASSGQLERWFMSKLESVLTTRDIALAAFVAAQMKNQNLELSPEQQASLYAAAGAFRNTEAGKAFTVSSGKAVPGAV